MRFKVKMWYKSSLAVRRYESDRCKEDHQSWIVNVVDPLISCLSQRKSGDEPGQEMYHLCS